MPVKVFSCLVQGLEGQLVEVEADILQGLSAFTIVGLGDTSVQESKERIRSAIKSTTASYPQQKKIINLAPASLRKQGPSLDLPIAISLLAASEQVSKQLLPDLENSLFIGELALDGVVRPVQNILSIALFAREKGWKKLFLPSANLAEASLVRGLQLFPVNHLQEIFQHLSGQTPLTSQTASLHPQADQEIAFDLNLIQGQSLAKRAIQIAAAGGHHLLLYGQPGVGKTLIARALAEILPPLSEQEQFETMQIYSASGKLNLDNPLISRRPFRQIHQSASLVSLTGGGSPIKPGEISLAHNGVLFVDEIAEFPRSIIETLRQPLEDKKIHISRQGQQIILPANFTLVAAMNPCPCGYFGAPDKTCTCSPSAISNYRKKISGPIFDRIDLTVALSKPKFSITQLTNPDPSNNSTQLIKTSIQQARLLQHQRFQHTKIASNAHLTSQNIHKYLRLAPSAQEYLQIITDKVNLSARAHLHLLKTALTISDLKQQDQITNIELAEAFQYRNPNLFENHFG